MPRANGARSRDGCSNCRRRKRRCDESKPVCFTCRRTGAECIYPVPGSASNPLKFVVATSPVYYTIPTTHHDNKPSFLHLFMREMPVFCPGIRDTDIDPMQDGPRVNCGDGVRDEHIQLHCSIPRQLSRLNGSPDQEAWSVETALIQYYAEVVSSSRVYVQTDRNLFRISVMPRVLLNQGPLYSTVLAMSAAEWGQNFTNGRDYNAISARYKVRALHKLQNCLEITESSEENLLTCVLLASIEISEGSRPTWLQHLQGALALLENFASSIDPSVATFALQYFQFRYILMETTQPKRTPPTSFDRDGSSHDSYHHAMSRIAEVECTLPPIHGSGNLIDEHLGCSMELVDIINQISALSLAAASEEREVSVEQRYAECQSLEHRILQISPEIDDMGNEYLLKSAESFQIAAQIYLRLTHLDIYIKDPWILELHQRLLNYLSEIIVEGQPRRSFPMWPLFIAGCTCSSDEHRKVVLGLFTILDSQWPISNISAVWNAVRTVWHMRDLSTEPESRKHDWQEIIHKFGWKLSLS